jgi:hypothetical protein
MRRCTTTEDNQAGQEHNSEVRPLAVKEKEHGCDRNDPHCKEDQADHDRPEAPKMENGINAPKP